MRVADFDYQLPAELIAQRPAPERSASRLLRLNAASGALEDLAFTDLPGRAKDIRRHHEERLARLREAAAQLGEASVEQLAQRLFRPRSWGSMAGSET